MSNRGKSAVSVMAYVLAVTIVTYCLSFMIWKAIAMQDAQSHDIKGYYFVGVSAVGDWRSEGLVRLAYSPLIFIDVNVFGGDAPAAPPDLRLGP